MSSITIATAAGEDGTNNISSSAAEIVLSNKTLALQMRFPIETGDNRSNLEANKIFYQQVQIFDNNFNGNPFDFITMQEFPRENDFKLVMVTMIVAAIVYLAFVIYALVILRDDETKRLLPFRHHSAFKRETNNNNDNETARTGLKTTATATLSSSTSSPEKPPAAAAVVIKATEVIEE